MGRLLQTIKGQLEDTITIEKLKNECKLYGINDLTNPMKRSIITAQTATYNGTEITYEKNPFYKIQYDMDGIFSKAMVLKNLKYNSKIPVMDINRVFWTDNSILDAIPTISSKNLQPRTLMTFIDVSRELINQTDYFENFIIEQVTVKFKEKLLQEILKMYTGRTDVTELSDYDSLVEFKYNGDLNPVENSFIISPLAQKKINLMKDGNLIQNNKLLSADAYCTNLMNDGYIVYCPLNCLVVAEWGILDYTRDEYTLAKDGLIRLTFRGFFDWTDLRPGLVRVGRFTEPEPEPENDNNGENNGENAG